jgi:hypothetical protein
MKAVLGGTPDASAANEQLAQLIAEAESSLDTDAILSTSIKNANMLLPSFYPQGEQQET